MSRWILWGLCLPAPIKQDLAHLYSWETQRSASQTLPSKPDLLPSYRGCGQHMATNCQLLQGQRQRYRAASPQVHPFRASLHPVTEHSEGLGQAISTQHGILTINTHFSALGPVIVGSIGSALLFDSPSATCFLPFLSQVSSQ